MKAHSRQRVDLTEDAFFGEYNKGQGYEGVEIVDYLEALAMGSLGPGPVENEMSQRKIMASSLGKRCPRSQLDLC